MQNSHKKIIFKHALGEYFGFTKEEVQEQCRHYGIDYTEMEAWYDGYCVGSLHIYNPKSVSDALIWKEFQSYWTGTENYEALKIYIDMNFDGLIEALNRSEELLRNVWAMDKRALGIICLYCYFSTTK